MLRSAALVDPEAADMLAVVNEQRYTGQGVVARGVRERGTLRAPLTEHEAHDIIYALMSPELRRVLMHEREWLADTLCATLLDPSHNRRMRRNTGRSTAEPTRSSGGH